MQIIFDCPINLDITNDSAIIKMIATFGEHSPDTLINEERIELQELKELLATEEGKKVIINKLKALLQILVSRYISDNKEYIFTDLDRVINPPPPRPEVTLPYHQRIRNDSK